MTGRGLGAIAATVLALSSAGPLAAQTPARSRPLENIKVLGGWTGDEVRAEMRRMSEAIGEKCDFCHVQGNFVSDEKRAKHTGRRMLELTLAINNESFPGYVPKEGESKLGRVTCFTCHQGTTTPRLAPGGGGPR